MKSKEWMISPANEGQDEVVCDPGYEKNFPEHSFVHVIEKTAFTAQVEAFEYLVSMLPEECTAGFVTHARAIASGDTAEIERTK